jgi:putative oxidoreductase
MQADKLLSLARCGCRKFSAAADYLQSPLLLAVRLYWGWQFAQAGWGHLTHLERTASQFAEWNIPAPKLNAIMAGTTECVGGALLLVGLASRLVSLPLIVTMIVAYVTTEHLSVDSDGNGVGFSDMLDNFTKATPFLFLFACLLVLAFGPGAFSLDRLIARKFGTAPATR